MRRRCSPWTLGSSRSQLALAVSLRWELGAFTALAVDTLQCAARSRRSWINSQPALASSPSACMRHHLPHKTASLLHHSAAAAPQPTHRSASLLLSAHLLLAAACTLIASQAASTSVACSNSGGSPEFALCSQLTCRASPLALHSHARGASVRLRRRYCSLWAGLAAHCAAHSWSASLPLVACARLMSASTLPDCAPSLRCLRWSRSQWAGLSITALLPTAGARCCCFVARGAQLQAASLVAAMVAGCVHRSRSRLAAVRCPRRACTHRWQ